MSKKNSSLGLPIGGPTLLMIFVILCINIFAVISYMSALRDYNLSEKAAEKIKQYYTADSKAEKMLSDIVNGSNKNDNLTYFEYSIPVNQDMVLKVAVEISKLTNNYDIIMWKKINTAIHDDNETFLELPNF